MRDPREHRDHRAERRQKPAHENRGGAPSFVKAADLLHLLFVDEQLAEMMLREKSAAVAMRQEINEAGGTNVHDPGHEEDGPKVRASSRRQESTEQHEGV